jgi:hypothetical protein
MMHDYHQALPGFDERQILHDGCAECEHRGKDVPVALANLDSARFEKAWERAGAFWNDDELALTVSRAERPLLDVLYAVRVHLDRRALS